MKNNIDIETYIRKTMYELGFKPNLGGYEIFKDAILFLLEDEERMLMNKEDLCNELGEKRGVNVTCIKKELRHVIETRVRKKNKLSEFIFRDGDNLILSECLALVSEYVRLSINKENKIEQRISHIAYSLGISFSSKGYIYFKDAMQELISNYNNVKWETLYDNIAEKHFTTTSSVKHSFINIIIKFKQNHPNNEISNYLYQKNIRLSSSEFLSLLATYTRLIDKSNEKTVYDTIMVSEDNKEDIDFVNDMSLESRIEMTMLNIGVPTNISGYYFLKDAVLYLLNSDNSISWLGVYEDVANTYSTSIGSVERGIRYAISLWSKEVLLHNDLSNVNKFIKNNGVELANSEFIALVAEYIKINFKECLPKKEGNKSKNLIRQD